VQEIIKHLKNLYRPGLFVMVNWNISVSK